MKNVKTCVKCRKMFLSIPMGECVTEIQCDECSQKEREIKENIRVCVKCGKNMHRLLMFVRDGEYYCNTCYQENKKEREMEQEDISGKCDFCSFTVSQRKLKRIDGKLLCISCLCNMSREYLKNEKAEKELPKMCHCVGCVLELKYNDKPEPELKDGTYFFQPYDTFCHSDTMIRIEDGVIYEVDFCHLTFRSNKATVKPAYQDLPAGRLFKLDGVTWKLVKVIEEEK